MTVKPLLSLLPAALLAAACAGSGSSGPADVPGRAPIPAASEPFLAQAPSPPPAPRPHSASLWDASATGLLGMRRAKEVGDLLTVTVEMNDQANVQSSLSRSRDSNENSSVGALLGLPSLAGALLPSGASLSPSYELGSSSGVSGQGSVARAEQMTFTLAARVIGVEPNGNLFVQGYQQTQVSGEIRYLTVSGVIRPQDITRDNTVDYKKIAEARLSYVSEGEATAPVRRGSLPKVLDRVMPF